MTRPCFLVVDREHAGSISTRKLVIETAKLNVVTSYSSAEAIETLQRFPNLDAAVLDAGINDMPCEELIRALKTIKPSLPAIVIGAPHSPSCPSADHFLHTFDPVRLLQCLKKIEPERSAVIELRETELETAPDKIL